MVVCWLDCGDKQGFLTCVFSKSAEIFISHPHDGSRRTAKELFLNYGIFLFSLIGAVSIWMRMYSWVSFLNVIIGFWIAALSLIKILDRRIFYYRYFSRMKCSSRCCLSLDSSLR